MFSDEIHAPHRLLTSAAHVPLRSVYRDLAASHTITAASASKAWNLAGLKCAQVILSNDADAAMWGVVRIPGPAIGTSTLGVLANTAAYCGGGPLARQRSSTYLDGNRRLLTELVAEHLPDVRLIMPEGTYIALLDFRTTGLTGDLGEWFREHAGVAMTDGAACGEAAIGHTRFVFAMPRPIMREAILRIATALAVRAGDASAVGDAGAAETAVA